MVISIEKSIKERDVEAALYLLSRMLNLKSDEKRTELQAMYDHIKSKRSIDHIERAKIVSLYREVVG